MNNKESKFAKFKRISALIGAIILAVMAIATLVVACLRFPGSDSVFKGLLGLDIAIPVLLWFYLYLLKRAEKTDKELADKSEKKSENKDEK